LDLKKKLCAIVLSRHEQGRNASR